MTVGLKNEGQPQHQFLFRNQNQNDRTRPYHMKYEIQCTLRLKQNDTLT